MFNLICIIIIINFIISWPTNIRFVIVIILNYFWDNDIKNNKTNEESLDISLEKALLIVLYFAASPYALGSERVNEILQDHAMPLDLFGDEEVKISCLVFDKNVLAIEYFLS